MRIQLNNNHNSNIYFLIKVWNVTVQYLHVIYAVT